MSSTIPLIPSIDKINNFCHSCRRIVVMGSMGVGKTAVVARFLDGVFNDRHIPTIEDFHQKLYEIRSESYKLDILDTSGINLFPAMRRLSIQIGDMFILVYSIDKRESFEEVKRLYEQIIQVKGEMLLGGRRSKRKTEIPIIIVGNKCDLELERQVSTAELRRSVSSYSDCVSLEVSAKRNINIEECFLSLFTQANLPTDHSPLLRHKAQTSSTIEMASPRNYRRRRSTLSDSLSDIYSYKKPSISMDLLRIKELKAARLDEFNSRQTAKCSIQ